MARKNSKQPKSEPVPATADFSALTEEQTADLLEIAVETLCLQLETAGADPDLITGILFNHFTQRLCDVNDREQYEMVLEMALETPWDDITVH